MPKIGRKLDVFDEAMVVDIVSKNAPFGNSNTELKRLRIIGGKAVYEKDRGLSTSHVIGVHTIEEKTDTNVDGYKTADHDIHGSHVHNTTTNNKSLNPHPLIPPIATKSLMVTTATKPTSNQPVSAITTVSKTKCTDELTLRQRVAGYLLNFDRTNLKVVYTDLANYDEMLTGFTTSDKLRGALTKAKVNISADDLRRIFSLYTTTSEPEMINYEKVLSFIAACAFAVPNDSDHTSNHQAQQAANSQMNKLNISYARKCFEQAAKLNNGSLSKDQIKMLSDTCGIHFLDKDMDRILEHFKESQSCYNWDSYLDYLQLWQKQADKNSESEEDLSAKSTLPLLRHPREEKLDELSRRHEELKFAQSYADTQRQAAMARQVQIQKEAKADADSSWFERFMKLANALYENDTQNTGDLSRDEVSWLVSEYNNAYNLGLSADVMTRAITTSTIGENVIAVDTLLKTLGMCGP